MHVLERAGRAIRLTLAGSFGSILIQSAILVVLARLLTPNDYGQYAAAMVLVQPLQNVVVSTAERALVIGEELSEQTLATVLGTLLALLIALAFLVGGAALLVAHWFDLPIGNTIAVFCLLLPLAVLPMTERARLRRAFEFGRLVRCDLAAQIAGPGVAAVACAAAGFGPFSLAVGGGVQFAVQAIAYRGGRIPQIRFSAAVAIAPLKTSFSIAKISAVELFRGQVPATAIGSLLGASPLGLYNRAYMLVQVPVEVLTSALNRVLVPGFVALRSERERFQSTFYKSIEILSMAVVPASVGIAAAAPDLVAVLLGPRWMSVVPLIGWMAAGAGATMLGTQFAVVLEATMHLKAKFYAQLASLAAAIGLFFFLAPMGLVSAAIAFAASFFVYFFIQAALCVAFLDFEPLVLVARLMPGLVGGGVVFATVLAVAQLNLQPPAALLLDAGGSVVALVVMTVVAFPRMARDLLVHAGLTGSSP
jgi:O-antigen/teichoic acid export membrane protein